MFITRNKNLTLFASLLPFTIFTKELGMLSIGGIQFDFISYPFFIIVFLTYLLSNRITIRKTELLVFGYILTIGIVNIILFNLQVKPFIKQLFPILLIYFSIKTIFKYNNIIDIFKRYLELTLIVAFIGILQMALKLVGINFLTPLGGFYLDSIALEPSHYVLIVLPAIIYYMEKKEYHWKFFIIFLTLLLTFKITALVSIVVYVLLRNIRKLKKQLFFGSLMLIIFYYIINQIPEFSDRFYSMLTFLDTNNISNIQNLTTFSFVSNAQIAFGNFIRTYGFGIGLGGHEEMYYRYMTKHIFSQTAYGINAPSAHCLTLRIISELGIMGILLYVILFYKVTKIKNLEYSAIAWGSLGHFIGKSFKLGSYFDYGSLFFLLMIITAIKLDKEEKS